MATSPWAPVPDADRYHGQIDTTDRRSFWVYGRLHLATGWCVEVHLDAPDGPLLARSWWSNSTEAWAEVDGRRRAIGRLDAVTALDLPWTVDRPRTDLGVIVAHGRHGRSPATASIDGDARGPVCRVQWVPAGAHQVRWLSARDLEVAAQQVVHVHHRWFGLLRPPDGRTIPPWHRCAARSLRFEDGLLRADRDVRAASQRG